MSPYPCNTYFICSALRVLSTIIKRGDSKAKLERLERRGLSLVRIETDQDEMELER
jgi:hypothetical protein